MLKTILVQESKADAEAQRIVVADAIGEKQPKLDDLMDASRATYIDFSGSALRRSPTQTRSSA